MGQIFPRGRRTYSLSSYPCHQRSSNNYLVNSILLVTRKVTNKKKEALKWKLTTGTVIKHHEGFYSFDLSMLMVTQSRAKIVQRHLSFFDKGAFRLIRYYIRVIGIPCLCWCWLFLVGAGCFLLVLVVSCWCWLLPYRNYSWCLS